MAPEHIEVGMELSGTTGAAAPGTNFSRNFGSQFIDVNGTITLNAPITAEWESFPNPFNAGGSFRTACCF